MKVELLRALQGNARRQPQAATQVHRNHRVDRPAFHFTNQTVQTVSGRKFDVLQIGGDDDGGRFD